MLGAIERIDRMIRNVELHDAFAKTVEALTLGAHHDAFGHRRGAGRGRAAPPFDLNQAQSAGTERIEHVGGAKLRNLDPGLHRRTHDRCAFRY